MLHLNNFYVENRYVSGFEFVIAVLQYPKVIRKCNESVCVANKMYNARHFSLYYNYMYVPSL